MEKVVASGKARAIGVANYSVQYLEELLPHVSIVPAVNQIENHPLLPQQEIVDFCDRKGIHVTAYSPLGSSGSPLIQLPVINAVAERRSATPALILINWHSTLKQTPFGVHAASGSHPCVLRLHEKIVACLENGKTNWLLLT